MRSHPAQFRPFLYALDKMYSKTKSIESDLSEKEREIDLEFCSKDKDGFAVQEKSIIKSRGLNGETREEEVSKFKFTTDALLAAGKRKRAIMQEEVDIEPHLTTDIPADLDFNWWRVLSPFVLPDEPSEEQLQELYKRSEEKTK